MKSASHHHSVALCEDWQPPLFMATAACVKCSLTMKHLLWDKKNKERLLLTCLGILFFWLELRLYTVYRPTSFYFVFVCRGKKSLRHKPTELESLRYLAGCPLEIKTNTLSVSLSLPLSGNHKTHSPISWEKKVYQEHLPTVPWQQNAPCTALSHWSCLWGASSPQFSAQAPQFIGQQWQYHNLFSEFPRLVKIFTNWSV